MADVSEGLFSEMKSALRKNGSDREYLLNCLAKFVCGLPTKERRKKFLVKFQEAHGSDVCDELKRRVMTRWRENRH